MDPHKPAQKKWIQLRMRLDLHKTIDDNSFFMNEIDFLLYFLAFSFVCLF